MDLSMSIMQYNDYCYSTVEKKELDAVYAELAKGEYQKNAIRDYNKKYSLLERLSANYSETEHIKACKESIKWKKEFGKCTITNELLAPFYKKIGRKIDEMSDNYEKCFLHEIEEKAKSCDKALVKKIADKCYNQSELNKDGCSLCITDTFVDGTIMQVPLSSLGVNPIRGKFEQAGLAAAVLAELRKRYKQKFNEELTIRMQWDSADDSEEFTNRMINEGIYTRGNSYITIELCNEKKSDGGRVLNI